MKTKIVFAVITLISAFLFFIPAPLQAATLDSLPTGAAIQMTGQAGALYKFIKMIPKDDDGNTTAHSDGTSGSYWMLADNYCELTGRPSNCVNRLGDTSTGQAWNPTSDGTRRNNWTTMANTSGSVYQNVLTQFYNDLPNTIGTLNKDSAILTKAYPMYSITNTSGIGTTTKSTCYLTAGSAGTGTADLNNCTWADKISLPSYTDWQNGLNARGFYAPSSSNAYAHSMTRFGTAWKYPSKFSEFPWLRSPSTNTDGIWMILGNSAANAVSTNTGNATGTGGVSPTLWLSSSITTTAGSGTYQKPYCLSGDTSCNLIMTSPVAAWNSSIQTLGVTGIVNYPASGQSIIIWAAACNSAGQCQQKSTTVISNSSGQAYNLTWLASELPAGEYDGTIWVGAHVIASANDEDNAFNQSNAINFSISPRQMDLTITKDRAFNIVLGDAAIFNLTPGTNQGVTVSVDSSTNQLTVSGTLSAAAQIPFGSAILNFKTFEIPQSVVINDTLSLN